MLSALQQTSSINVRVDNSSAYILGPKNNVP